MLINFYLRDNNSTSKETEMGNKKRKVWCQKTKKMLCKVELGDCSRNCPVIQIKSGCLERWKEKIAKIKNFVATKS